MSPANTLWSIEWFTHWENGTYGVGFWTSCGDSCVSSVVGEKTCKWCLVHYPEKSCPSKKELQRKKQVQMPSPVLLSSFVGQVLKRENYIEIFGLLFSIA